MARFAWVTLATNDSYSLGALVLGHSLRRANTAHQLVVLITPSVTEAMRTQLSAVYNEVKVVDVLDSKDAENLSLLARPELGITFTKLHCWRLTDFDKCVFLDADTLVLQNSDELFDREEFSAAPDAGWPDCFNSGVFVFKPSNDTFQALIKFALIHGSFDGGDQGLLNLFFSDWATKDITKHLPFVYNMCSTATYSYLPAFKQFGQGLKIIHFIGAAKPWLQPFNTETSLVQVSGESHHIRQFVQFWWDLFCTNVHPNLNSEMAGLAGALASVTLGSPLSAEQCALEEHLRRQGWEQGNIDYMGKDSFANIWNKICDTLSGGSQPVPSRDIPAPVAPIAAPVFVSSVEMSPAGPIDTSPPASYAPVSALKLTVVASDTEAVCKAAPTETSTVTPEPKSPSVTEVASAEVISSAVAVPSQVASQVSADNAAADSQPVVSTTQPATLTAPTQAVISILKQEEFPTETKTPPTTPITDSAPIIESSLTTAADKTASTVAEIHTLSTEEIKVADMPLSVETVSDESKNIAEVQIFSSVNEGITLVESPKSEDASVTAPIKTDIIPLLAAENAGTDLSKVDETPLILPINIVSVSGEAAKPDNIPVVPANNENIVTEVLPSPVSQADDPKSPSIQNKDSTGESTVVSPENESTAENLKVQTENTQPNIEAQVETPMLEIVAKTDDSIAAPSQPEVLGHVAQPVPAVDPVASETHPVPVLATTQAPSVETAASEEPKPIPIQPETPTIIEPTPPTSPQAVSVEPPLAEQLQVDTAVEDTVTQPIVGATGSSEEPPVPPKRKGGSKATQEAKNQKGGKPSKGKK